MFRGLFLIESKSTASGRATRRASERSVVYEGVDGDRFSLWEDPVGQEGGTGTMHEGISLSRVVPERNRNSPMMPRQRRNVL